MPNRPKKEEVYEWIKNNLKTPLSAKQIAQEMGISHYTALKWIHVLSAEGRIKASHHGNVLIVYPMRNARPSKTKRVRKHERKTL